MRVFISWSGEKSKKIASVFKDWIPAVIQAAKPYFSPSDIDKGARWSSEIAKELEASRIGLICLTADNLEAPWLMFEAGALSKSMDKSRVCPMLFGVEPTDLAGPLVQFQAAPFSKDEVRKVMKTINLQLGDAALDGNVLESVFDKWWPELEEKVNSILTQVGPANAKGLRSDRELLEEVLKIARTLAVRDRDQTRERPDRYRSSPRLASEIAERQLELMGEVLMRSHDLTLLMDLNEKGTQIMQLLFKNLSPDDEARLGPKTATLFDALHSKIKEIEEIPF
ncbi:MAG TPA: TIR domain-containing protein [Azospira sp.]|nr:TIR domain-containing protein [Azospira sp.]